MLSPHMSQYLSESEKGVIEKTEELLSDLMLENALELYDVEFRGSPRGGVLRVYVNKQGGISVDECAVLSRELGTLLEVHGVVKGRYTLEVSSPGLTRALKKPKDYERAIGKRVKITTRAEIDKRRQFKGTLVLFDEMVATIDADGESIAIPFEDVKKANLEVDF